MELIQRMFGAQAEKFLQATEMYNLAHEDDPLDVSALSGDGFIEVQEHHRAMEQLRLDSAIDLELTKSGAKNLTAVRALLNTEGVSLSDGIVSGLAEQIKTLRSENSYLFQEPVYRTAMPQGVGGAGSDIFMDSARKAAGIAE